jgi:hypothetical protein
MISNLFIFILFYILISTSVIGYGLLFFSLNKKLKISSNFGYAGLAGVFILCLYSYFSSFFYKHDEIHNLVLILIGFFYFVYFNYTNFKSNHKNLIALGYLLIIYFIGVCIFKTHDDFSYYHFQYSYYLTQIPSVIGIGNFDLGLRTPSSIFYFNSLLYFPFIKYFMFHMSALVIFLYANIIIIFKILKYDFFKKFDFLSFYYLLTFIFINVFFYRFSEHGTDRSAQILVFILIGEIIAFVNFKLEINKILSRLFLLIALIISLKAFYILYLIFFSIIFLHLIKTHNLRKSFIFLIKNSYFYLFLLLLFLILIVNFINTGCLIYPVSITCFDHFSWALPDSEVRSLNSWYEQWSKGGAGPNFRINNPEIYIQKFNWVTNWINVYFFNKVSDFLLGLIFLSLVVMATFSWHKKIILNKKRKVFFTFTLIIILFLEWFYNHPALRYGGYCLIASFVFINLSLYIEKIQIDYQKAKRRIIFLLVLSLIIFFVRNLSRLFNEYKQYGYKPIENIYYQINDSHFNLQKTMEELILNYRTCTSLKNQCVKDKRFNVSFVFQNYIFSTNK